MDIEISFDQKNLIFEKYLGSINNINFTLREVDVLSFILHNRGEKKIAKLLNISPRTVSCHIHNIMRKISCGSREMVLDFIEKSGKINQIKHYYVNRLIEIQFDECLKKLSNNLKSKDFKIFIEKSNLDELDDKIVNRIKSDISRLNIHMENEENQNLTHVIQITETFEANHKNLKVLNITLPSKVNFSNDKNANNFSEISEYYFSFLMLIKNISDDKSSVRIIAEFNQTYDNTISYLNGISPPNYLDIIDSPKNESIIKHYIPYFIILLTALGIFSIFLYKNFDPLDQIKKNIAFELPLPHKEILLDRTKILKEIDSKFVGKDGIRVVAIVGAGGSGKTTIARQYAKSKNSILTFEINAESNEKILSSLEQIANTLSINPEDQKILELIDNMQDSNERNTRLLQFITKKIRKYDNWLLIYNDVATFNDIRKYFPYDDNVWGNGRVLITTRDSNIASNYFIPSTNIINSGELCDEEKTFLFNSIINQNSEYKIISEYDEIIKKIPSFPLDIILAAYYIKSENTSAEEYLKYLSKPDKVYLSAQKIILDDVGEYTKTRFDIVTLSLKQILSENIEFLDMIFLLSLIDSENIPKNLLVTYKDDVTLSNLIHSLKRLSLLSKSRDKSFSIHKATQEIMKQYILANFDKEYIEAKYAEISELLENYILDESIRHNYESYLLISHVEKFLSHQDDGFSKIQHANLLSKLGSYYLHIGNNIKSKEYLEKSLKVFIDEFGKTHIKSGQIMSWLGVVYRNLGDEQKAKSLLETALEIYIKHNGIEHLETLRIYTYLGSVYRYMGEYQKAIDYLEKVYKIYKESYGSYNSTKIAWVSAYLGITYQDLGNYKKARELLEYAYNSYKKYRGTQSSTTAWVASRLGNLYIASGDYKLAKELLTQSLEIYKVYNGENSQDAAWCMVQLSKISLAEKDYHNALSMITRSIEIYKAHINEDNYIMAWSNIHLANLYIELGKTSEAISLLNNSCKIYEKHYGSEHIKLAGVLSKLSQAYLKEKNYENAELYARKALTIYSSVKHPETNTIKDLLHEITKIKP
jgi:tetratricopeptide (TPR) repeat protein/DNA-binding CsgD family transcriptional regulator